MTLSRCPTEKNYADAAWLVSLLCTKLYLERSTRLQAIAVGMCTNGTYERTRRTFHPPIRSSRVAADDDAAITDGITVADCYNGLNFPPF